MTILSDNECILVTGFDDCIITHTIGANVKAVYSTDRIIKKLMEDDMMTEEDAWEHFYFNIVGGVPGLDADPVFLYDVFIYD